MVTRPPRASAILRIRNPSFNQSATLAPPNPICIESNSFVKHHRFWPNHTETLVFSRSHCKPKYYFGFAQKILHFLDFLVFFLWGGGVVCCVGSANSKIFELSFWFLRNWKILGRERERLLGGNENRESWKYSLMVGICVMWLSEWDLIRLNKGRLINI